MSVSTTALWLKCASAILLILGGVALALGAYPASSGIAALFTDAVIWPFDGAQSLAAPETRILAAIGGGITAGWGALVWQVAHHVMPKDPQTARRISLTSLFTWFAVDSVCSVLAGAPLNAGVNAVLLLVFLWPLLRMERGAAAAAA